MSRDARRATGSSDPITVVVKRTLRGRWEVVLPGRRTGITCETLDDARRMAYLSLAHGRPCELIVRDAYHRVLSRELIDGHQLPLTDPHPTAEQQRTITNAAASADAPRLGDAPDRRRRNPSNPSTEEASDVPSTCPLGPAR